MEKQLTHSQKLQIRSVINNELTHLEQMRERIYDITGEVYEYHASSLLSRVVTKLEDTINLLSTIDLFCQGKYTVQPYFDHANPDEEQDLYIVLTPDGYDLLGEAVILEEAERIAAKYNAKRLS